MNIQIMKTVKMLSCLIVISMLGCSNPEVMSSKFKKGEIVRIKLDKRICIVIACKNKYGSTLPGSTLWNPIYPIVYTVRLKSENPKTIHNQTNTQINTGGALLSGGARNNYLSTETSYYKELIFHEFELEKVKDIIK